MISHTFSIETIKCLSSSPTVSMLFALMAISFVCVIFHSMSIDHSKNTISHVAIANQWMNNVWLWRHKSGFFPQFFSSFSLAQKICVWQTVSVSLHVEFLPSENEHVDHLGEHAYVWFVFTYKDRKLWSAMRTWTIVLEMGKKEEKTTTAHAPIQWNAERERIKSAKTLAYSRFGIMSTVCSLFFGKLLALSLCLRLSFYWFFMTLWLK